MSSPSVIVISPRDNVATALQALSAGETIVIDDRSIVAASDIASGHKMAIARIAAGDAVIKYGSPIGTATVDIEPGMHVHTHNVASGRGRGDLAASHTAEAKA